MKSANGKECSKNKLLGHVGNIAQLASVRRYRFDDGPALNMRAVEVSNGSGLSFTVLPDRGMDISRASFNNINLCYLTPNAETHPAFYECDGAGWLNTFNGGLLTTCGLSHFGPPDIRDGESLGLHGRFSTIPARQLSDNSAWIKDEFVVSLSGIIEEARLFGNKLRLTREIRTVAGESRLFIEDSIENFGNKKSSFMILYHFNLGFPLLSNEAILKLSAEKSEPRDKEAEKGFKNMLRFPKPSASYDEQVFFHKMRPDKQGFSKAELVNPSLGISFYLEFNSAALPYLTQWKMAAKGEYVLGLEPCNAPCMDRQSLIKKNLMPYLEPGQVAHTSIEVGINQH
ncbi:MAG: aldose 1-epimerase family protein [Victivallales bacterium]|nr:aldose 1-epimerase family protein [Victivallales bacterium]